MEKRLSILMNKIRVICEFNYVKKAIDEIKKFDKEHYIETSSKEEYDQLYNEFNILYILINGKQDDIAKLYQKQDDEITRHRKNMLGYALVVLNLNEWNEYKKDVLTTEKNYQRIILKLEEKGISIHNPKNEKYIELLSNCIKAIEKKYNNQINKEDIPFIMQQIATLCEYNEVKLSMQEIEAQAEPGDRVYIILDYFKRKHYILEDYKDQFKKLVIKQGELYENYLEARFLIFNESYEEARKER